LANLRIFLPSEIGNFILCLEPADLQVKVFTFF